MYGLDNICRSKHLIYNAIPLELKLEIPMLTVLTFFSWFSAPLIDLVVSPWSASIILMPLFSSVHTSSKWPSFS